MGQHVFVRAVLPVAVLGGDGAEFNFGVWASIKEDHLKAVEGGQSGYECFSWLMNQIPGVDTDGPSEATLNVRGDGLVPLVTVHHGPVAHMQHTGLSFDQLLMLYDMAGMEHIRQHIGDA